MSSYFEFLLKYLLNLPNWKLKKIVKLAQLPLVRSLTTVRLTGLNGRLLQNLIRADICGIMNGLQLHCGKLFFYTAFVILHRCM